MGDSTSKAEYVKKMITEIDNIKDPVLREVTIGKLSDETNLGVEFLKSQLKTEAKEEKQIEVKKEVNLQKYEKAEIDLIYYMLKDSKVILQYEAKKIYLPTEKYRFLVRQICAFYQKYGNIDVADFLTFIAEDKEMIKALGEITSCDLKETYTKEEIEDYIRCIDEYNRNLEINNLKQKMKESIDYAEKIELAKKIAFLNGRGE